MYPHTTTPPWITRGWAEMYWAEYGAKHGTSPTHLCERDCRVFFFFVCTCVCVSVPRLPLLPMLGSLASAIQLYSGGMETGLRSPGTTNQQSECWLGGGRGGVAGRHWLRDSVGHSWRGGQVRGVCRWGGRHGRLSRGCYDIQGKGHMALFSGYSVKLASAYIQYCAWTHPV